MLINAEHPALRPTRAHYSDAGADLRSKVDYILAPSEQYLFDTGVAVAVPPGFVGLVFNRSSQGIKGLSIPHSVGVIDSEYRGNIKVLLKNNGTEPYEVKAKDTRIAQLVIVPIVIPRFDQYVGDDWNNTTRGLGGFGSTGS